MNTTKSFCFDTIRLDALLHKLKVLAHINTTSEVHETQIRLTRRVLAEPP